MTFFTLLLPVSQAHAQPERRAVERCMMAQNVCSDARTCLLGVWSTYHFPHQSKPTNLTKIPPGKGISHYKRKTNFSNMQRHENGDAPRRKMPEIFRLDELK
jgi:hypothetical protein